MLVSYIYAFEFQSVSVSVIGRLVCVNTVNTQCLWLYLGIYFFGLHLKAIKRHKINKLITSTEVLW